MSRALIVTFIGGSADLSKRVLESAYDRIDVPVMPRAEVLPMGEPIPKVMCEVETYRLLRVGRDTYVAVLEELL